MLGGDTELLNEHFDVSSLPSELGGAKDPYDPTDWIKTMIHADTQQNRQTDDVSITNPTIATSTWSMICTVRKTQWHKRNDICTIMIATENCTQMWQYSSSGLIIVPFWIAKLLLSSLIFYGDVDSLIFTEILQNNVTINNYNYEVTNTESS